MGEETAIINHPQRIEKPLPAHEGLVDLPDKRVLVIGTDHGSYLEPSFAGHTHVEEEMRNVFGENGPDALVLDSQPEYEEGKFPYYNFPSKDIVRIAKGEVSDKTLDFLGWGIKQAASGKSLILADPIEVVAFLKRSVFSELSGPEDSSLVKLTPQYQELEKELDLLSAGENLVDPAVYAILGLGISYGLLQRQKLLSRRAFLGGGLAAAAGLLLGKDEVKDQIGMLRHMRSDEFRDMQSVEGLKRLLRNDTRELTNKVFSKPRELTKKDRENPAFQRHEILSQALRYSITLRNAMIAEVLSLPSADLHLQGNHKVKPDIEVVMGHSHLVTPKTHSISWFLKNETERRGTIQGLLGGLLTSIKDGVYVYSDKVDIERFKEELRTFPRSYQIKRDGTVNATAIVVPFFEEALNTAA